MSNTMETKAYGQITSSAVEIRTDDTIDLCKGDCIYMTKPEIEGMTEMDEVSVTHYPIGDYEVKSIKPSYIGGNHIRNPTLITADLVTKND